MKVMFTNRIC